VRENIRKTSSTTGSSVGSVVDIIPAAGSTAARTPSKNSHVHDKKIVRSVMVCANPRDDLDAKPFLTEEYISKYRNMTEDTRNDSTSVIPALRGVKATSKMFVVKDTKGEPQRGKGMLGMGGVVDTTIH
jgi:hypothetical protein